MMPEKYQPRFLSGLHMDTCVCVSIPTCVPTCEIEHTHTQFNAFLFVDCSRTFLLLGLWDLYFFHKIGILIGGWRYDSEVKAVWCICRRCWCLFPSTIADGLQQSGASALGICCPLLASEGTWMYIHIHRYI